MSTISDVARRAGVSAMTVSRVITGTGHTSTETRARVEAAIDELGYVPNALARQLRSKRTKTIALLVSDISNPYFTTIARGVEDFFVAHRYSVMYGNTDEEAAEEEQYLLALIERQVEGVLLVPSGSSNASFELLQSHRTPFVVIDRRVTARSVDSVRCDSEAGAYALVEHLINLGHRRIAVLTGASSISTSMDRVLGARRALEDAGFDLPDSMIHYGSFNYGKSNQADGHRMALDMLAAGEPLPTAVFCANNFIAFGAIRALREAGLIVPDEMSVVAFDDLPEEWLSEPFLTVARQPAYDIGHRAAAMLMDQITGVQPPSGASVMLPFELVIRRSSAPPRPDPRGDPTSAAPR
jgi:LacI family transcriptional regulator, galactose operon repressor